MIQEYLAKIEEIRVREFLSHIEIARRIGISYSTWVRINEHPEKCSLSTARKLKQYVESWR